MNKVLIVGASGGIGRALVAEATSRGAEVTGLSRPGDGLDITDAASVDAALAPLAGPFDLIFVATGGLTLDGAAPEKSLKQVDASNLAAQYALNAIGPALILRHAPRLLPREGRSVFAALSARVGSIGDNRLGGWYGYRAAKAALNQILHTAAIELARTHPGAIVAALHPGTVATPLTQPFVRQDRATPPDEAARNLLDVAASLKVTGAFHDYAGKEIQW